MQSSPLNKSNMKIKKNIASKNIKSVCKKSMSLMYSAPTSNSSSASYTLSMTTLPTSFAQQKSINTRRRMNLRCYDHKKKKTNKIQKKSTKPTSTRSVNRLYQKIYKRRIENYYLGNFGFKPNVKQKIWQNTRKAIGEMML